MPGVLTPDALPVLLGQWAADRSPHSVTKQPFFPKSWQSTPARIVRTLLAAGVSAAARLPAPFSAAGRLALPDLATQPATRLAIKSVNWSADAAILAGTLPGSRTLFMLRHPCGQVASVMRGNRQRRFDLRTEGTDMPFDEAATLRFASGHGVGTAAFQALPDAAKYAWSWRAFNEPAHAALATRPNVHVVLYEALCAEPARVAREIAVFVGLDWTRQTADFVARSTSHRGKAGYHAIFRDTSAAAESWRSTMSQADRSAVGAVVAASPLTRFWPGSVPP